MIGRLGERLGGDAPAHLGGVKTELLGGLIDLALEREAGLWRAVATLGTAWRLVGEDARALKLVDRDLVGDRIDHTGVEGRSHAVRAIGSAIKPGLEVTAGDIAILRKAGFDPHEHGVAAAVDVKDFLSGERDLHRAPGELGELAGRDLMGERIELAAKAASNRRGN